MNQLALFEALPAPTAVPRATLPTTRRQVAAGGRAAGRVLGTLVRLPITASIQGKQWRQYTMGLSGRVELIEGDLAGVRIASLGHKFDGRLAVVELSSLSACN